MKRAAFATKAALFFGPAGWGRQPKSMASVAVPAGLGPGVESGE